MTVAIPTYKNQIAPSMDFCSKILLFFIEKQQILKKEVYYCRNDAIYARVKKLRDFGTQLILCNGISSSYLLMLQLHHIQVIPHLSGNIEDVLDNVIRKYSTKISSSRKNTGKKNNVKKNHYC